MAKKRIEALWKIVRGVLAATAVTLAGMVIMAAAVVFWGLPDGTLRILNQVLKLISVCLGVLLAIGVGGEKGFVTGAAVGLVYMIVGYACCCALGGMTFSWTAMLGEIVLGAAAGAIFGVVLANMQPRTRKKRAVRAV